MMILSSTPASRIAPAGPSFVSPPETDAPASATVARTTDGSGHPSGVVSAMVPTSCSDIGLWPASVRRQRSLLLAASRCRGSGSARRRARAVAGGDQCACCQGLGYRNPDAPQQP